MMGLTKCHLFWKCDGQASSNHKAPFTLWSIQHDSASNSKSSRNHCKTHKACLGAIHSKWHPKHGVILPGLLCDWITQQSQQNTPLKIMWRLSPKKKEEELPMDCPMCDTQKLLENRPHKITSGNKSSRYVKCKWGVKRLWHFHHLRQSNRFIRCHLPILLFPLHSIPLPEPLGNNQCFWP